MSDEGMDDLVRLIEADLADFSKYVGRNLTTTERMSFIAGHAAGFALGQKVEAAENEP